jgi:hypothetical protein
MTREENSLPERDAAEESAFKRRILGEARVARIVSDLVDEAEHDRDAFYLRSMRVIFSATLMGMMLAFLYFATQVGLGRHPARDLVETGFLVVIVYGLMHWMRPTKRELRVGFALGAVVTVLGLLFG